MHKTQHICILLLATCLLVACNKSETSNQTARPVAVRTVMLTPSEGTGSRSYMGEVEAVTAMPLYHALGGKLVRVHVSNGQHVTTGQPIANIDDTQARSLHETALATLSQAEDAHKRLLQVHESGGLSDVKWIEVQTNLEKARQQEIASRKALEDCHLAAPIDGVVSDLNVHAGQQLLPGQTICTMLSLNSLQVAFSVPEGDVAAFTRGDTVLLTLNAMPEQVFRGVVLEKGLSAGVVAHTYRIKARIPSPGRGILPGMIAKVLTTKSFARGLVVPSASVQTTPEGPTVWVVREGSAHRQLIGKTHFVQGGILVEEGLHAGDRVVTAGYQKLYNGAKVVEAE